MLTAQASDFEGYFYRGAFSGTREACYVKGNKILYLKWDTQASIAPTWIEYELEEDSTEFWEPVLKAGVLEWNRKYYPEEEVLDSLVWEVKIRTNDHTHVSEGYHIYPRGFEDLWRVIRHLSKTKKVRSGCSHTRFLRDVPS